MNFHVMKFRWFNLGFSTILLVGLLVLTFQKFGGFAMSIDFAGGIKLETTFYRGAGAGQEALAAGDKQDARSAVQASAKQDARSTVQASAKRPKSTQ